MYVLFNEQYIAFHLGDILVLHTVQGKHVKIPFFHFMDVCLSLRLTLRSPDRRYFLVRLYLLHQKSTTVYVCYFRFWKNGFVYSKLKTPYYLVYHPMSSVFIDGLLFFSTRIQGVHLKVVLYEPFLSGRVWSFTTHSSVFSDQGPLSAPWASAMT